MDQHAFEEYVETRYKKQMEYYAKASGENHKKYKLFQWILIVLSALTPVLAAMNGKKIGDDKTIHLDLVVIIVSAIVAILTTALKTFNYQEQWVSYRSTYEKLKPEIYYYDFNAGPYTVENIDKESLFVTRVETMLDKEHTQWTAAKNSSLRQQESNKDADNTQNTDNKKTEDKIKTEDK
ncbi:MAG: DUF4231 domain-containing protein [Bacteroidetes bacterium]|nr:DUF4231 domain-containing protein [Bacteroidota bacterium]